MKIAIAGYGLEGQSSYRYYSSDKNNEITIFDQRQPEGEIPEDVGVIVDENAFDQLEDFDLVIRTASLAPHKIVTNGKIWSATNEFFTKCPAKIIGVTGSKGKGTTASYIASILKAADKTVWLIGNIGKPSLDVLNQIKAEDIVVFELSSFQLWDLQKSPHIGVVLFIEQEHLDVHSNMKEYIDAKSNIAKYQTENDILIFNKDNDYSRSIAELSKGKKIGYQDSDSAHVYDDNFYYGEQKICSTDAMKIAGYYNLDNICASIDAVWSITNDSSAIEKGISDFNGLEHRLKFVKEVSGVKYYDNSIATTPTAAISSLKSFDQRKIIILGGSYKGSDFSEVVNTLKNTNSYAILIGKEGARIAEECKRQGFDGYEYFEGKNMQSIVEFAANKAKSGDVVLLSPSAASFDMFKNYSDRGEQFTAAVNKL